MQTMTQGYRSLSLLFRLNWDLIFTIVAILAALGLGGAIGSLIV